MRYTFESLPSQDPKFQAEKIILDGQHVGLLLCNQSVWVVHRLADSKNVTPWTQCSSVDHAKAMIQEMLPPEVLDDSQPPVWAVQCTSAYGRLLYAFTCERTGELDAERAPTAMALDEAMQIYSKITANEAQLVLGRMAFGDKITRVDLVRIRAHSDVRTTHAYF